MADPGGSSGNRAAQRESEGRSSPEIHAAAFRAAQPRPGLTWIDIGCGTGDFLRRVRDNAAPSELIGLDLIDWLADDLRDDVRLVAAPAEQAVDALEPADRVLIIEALDDLESPWTVLRAAAQLVRPGGRLVITTPSITTLRNRIELLTRGTLTSFRPSNRPQRTPTLPHIVEEVIRDCGLTPDTRWYAGRDIVPMTGGRLWPRFESDESLLAQLTRISVIVGASR